ncbi:hypothetical protein [Rhodococcus sp. USK13]|uniref:hypothetical protein n=1 Tax=Rhodococcus sp. USK13 TaxID=2806442 RepID=UPI001BD0B817|nr:hypothetical protein [Rhodococcus sp. USK13]
MWGHLVLGVEPADRDDLHPRELVISYMVSKDGPTITGGIFGDLPENWNELTTEEMADVPASFPDPTQQPVEFLAPWSSMNSTSCTPARNVSWLRGQEIPAHP